MPLKKIKVVCSDKKLKQGQLRAPAGYCFKRGLAAGFAAGIKKGEQKVLRRVKEAKAVREGLAERAKIPKASSLKGGEARGLLERYLAGHPRAPRKYMVQDNASKYNGTEQPISNLPLSDLRRILIEYRIAKN